MEGRTRVLSFGDVRLSDAHEQDRADSATRVSTAILTVYTVWKLTNICMVGSSIPAKWWQDRADSATRVRKAFFPRTGLVPYRYCPPDFTSVVPGPAQSRMGRFCAVTAGMRRKCGGLCPCWNNEVHRQGTRGRVNFGLGNDLKSGLRCVLIPPRRNE